MIDVIYEDNHLLVVNKPAGILTQPSGTDQPSLEGQAKAWLKEKYQKQGNVFLEAVHRIDKPVSGIVLFAKTSKALSRLNVVIREKRTSKYYTALVEGIVTEEFAALEHYLVHDDHKAYVTTPKDPQGKMARLHYKVLKRHATTTLLEIKLETGRYHQIRAQLAAIGHPIVGDAKYGSTTKQPSGNIALHHTRLEIPHPITGNIHTFEAPAKWSQSAWN